MRTMARRFRNFTVVGCATVLLAACRQDQILAEAAKFEDIQKNLHGASAAVVAAPAQACERANARNILIQPFTPVVVQQRIARKSPTRNCALVTSATKPLRDSVAILDDYAAALVRAAKGQTVPDAKVGDLIDTFRKANPDSALIPGIKTADINQVFNGLEALLDRNLRANQLRHIAHEVDAPLARVTTGLVRIFTDTTRCSEAGYWCSVLNPESQDLEGFWVPIAASMRAHVRPQQAAATAPHPPQYFAAQWEVRRRFEADVKAHEEALALGPAYADALVAFQREHAALVAVIDARNPDSTALLNR